MRSLLAAIVLSLAALPVKGGAQQVPGLDLSEPPREASPERDRADELPPLDLSEPERPARADAAEAEQRPRDFRPFSEKDVALGDKVKAVQRKGFLKRGRLELAPIFAATVNDAFFQKFGYGARLAYHLQDSLAVAVRGTRYENLRTDNVREGKIAFQSQLLESEIEQQAMLGFLWSPVYGKASFLANSIVHFDLFLQAGFGLVWSATSGPPLDQGPHGAGEFGGGVRFYPKDWLAFELGLLATFYSDQPAPNFPATQQRVFVANVGVSVFWPPSFDYVYP
jgi:outer membrane beta-barrel protein